MKKRVFLMLVLYPYLMAAELLICWGLLFIVKTTQGFIGVMIAAAAADAVLAVLFLIMLYMVYKDMQHIKREEYELSQLLKVNRNIKLMQIVPILIMGYFLFKRYFFRVGYFGLFFLIPIIIFIPPVFLLGGSVGHIAVNRLYGNGMMGERKRFVCSVLQYVPLFDVITALYVYGSFKKRLHSYGMGEAVHLEEPVQAADEAGERVLNFLMLYPVFGAVMTLIAELFVVMPNMLGSLEAGAFLSLIGRVLLPVVLVLFCVFATVWNIGIYIYILAKRNQGYTGEDLLEMSLDVKLLYRKIYVIIAVGFLLSLSLGTAGFIVAAALLYIACSMMWQSGTLAVKGTDDLYKRGMLTKEQIRLNKIGLFLILFDVKAAEELRGLVESQELVK